MVKAYFHFKKVLVVIFWGTMLSFAILVILVKYKILFVLPE